jgi:hypothetical protein
MSAIADYYGGRWGDAPSELFGVYAINADYGERRGVTPAVNFAAAYTAG